MTPKKSSEMRSFLAYCVCCCGCRWLQTGSVNSACPSIDAVLQDSGECDDLRLISNSPRSRVLGIGGDIVIQDTQVLLTAD